MSELHLVAPTGGDPVCGQAGITSLPPCLCPFHSNSLKPASGHPLCSPWSQCRQHTLYAPPTRGVLSMSTALATELSALRLTDAASLEALTAGATKAAASPAEAAILAQLPAVLKATADKVRP